MNLGSNALIGMCVSASTSVVDLRPRAPFSGALEDGFDDAVRAIAVLERGKGRGMCIARLLAVGDELIDVAHQVAERVGPRFLMSTGQVRVTADVCVDEGRILLKNLVRLV